MQGNDIDASVAVPLAARVVLSIPFMPAAPELVCEAKMIIDSVGTVIDSGCPTGEYNRVNAELLAYAEELGKTIIRSVSDLAEANI